MANNNVELGKLSKVTIWWVQTQVNEAIIVQFKKIKN